MCRRVNLRSIEALESRWMLAGDGLCEFDDFPDDAIDAPQLEVGSSVTGHMDCRYDRDWFAFSPDPDSIQPPVIQLTSATTLRIYDADGVTLLDEVTSIPYALEYDLTSRQNVYIEVSDDYARPEYELNITTRDADGYAIPVRQHIEIDTPTSLRITGTENDLFSFNAEANNEYMFTLTTSDYFGRLDFRIYDSDGNNVSYYEPLDRSNSDRKLVAWTAAKTETYFIQVTQTRSGNHEYQAIMQLASDLDDHGDDTESASMISANETVRGDLIGGDEDWFFLDVEANTSLVTTLSEGSRSYARLNVWGDGGTTLLHTPYIGSMLRLDFDSDQRIFLQVLDGLGDYELMPSVFVDDHGNDAETATHLPSNFCLIGNFEAAIDTDFFTFDVLAGTTYKITHSGLVGRHSQLYGASGSPTWTAERDATVTWEIQSRSGLAGQYAIKLESSPGEPASPENAIRIDTNARVSAEPRVPFVDWYVFHAIPGERYSFSTESDVDLQFWRRANSQNHSGGYLRVLEPTDVFVRVADIRSDYQFAVNAESPTVIVPSVEWQDELDARQEATFAFQAVPGEIYIVKGTSDIGRLRYSTLETEGTVIDGSLVSVTVEQPVYITVFADVPTAYTLQVDRLSDIDDYPANAPPGRLQLDVPGDGEFEVRGDVDKFVFSAKAGENYTVRLLLPRHYLGSISVYDRNGIIQTGFGHIAPDEGTFNVDSDQEILVEVRSRSIGLLEYNVVISTYEDDHGNRNDTATFVTAPPVFDGNLEVVDDIDRFAFDVQKGTAYHISNFGVEFRLLDAQGVPVPDVGSHHSIYWVPEENQRVYLDITSKESSEFPREYSLEFAEVGEDDHGNTADDATRLDSGNVVDGRINFGTDWFVFAALADTTYELIVDPLDFTVYSADGVVLNSIYNRDEFFRSDVDGDLFVHVTSPYQQHDYTIELQSFQDDHGDNEETATSISLNSTTQFRRDSRRDEDWFRFEVVAGQTYVTTWDRHVDMVFELPDASVFDRENGKMRWVAPSRAPVYAYVPADRDFGETYEMRFTSAAAFDVPSGNMAEATRFDLDSRIEGAIDFPGDIDWYYLNGQAGTEYRFSISNVIAEFYSSDGTQLEAPGKRVSLGENGRLFIKLYHGRFHEYRMTVTAVRDDHGDSIATSSDGRTARRGIIENEDDVDVFHFNLDAGTSYLLTNKTSSHVDFQIVNPRNEVVAEPDDFIDDRFVWTAEETGIYHGFVSKNADSRNFGLIEYTIHPVDVITIADDHGDDAANATNLQLGRSLSGQSEVPGEKDWFRVSLNGQTSYLASVSGIELTRSTRVNIYGGDGTTLLASRSYFETQVPVRLPEDGDIYIEVVGGGPASKYSVRVELGQVGSKFTAIDVEVPSTTTVAFTDRDEITYLAIDAVAGRSYRVFTSDNLRVSDLYTSTREKLTESFHPRNVAWTADRNLTIFARLQAWSSGEFEVTVEEYVPSSPLTAERIAVPDEGFVETLVAFDVAVSQNWHRFTAKANISYAISVNASSQHNSLIRESGEVIDFRNSYVFHSDVDEELILEFTKYSSPWEYQLKISSFSDDYPEEGEPLFRNSSRTSTLNSESDIDSFPVVALSGERLTFNAVADEDVALELAIWNDRGFRVASSRGKGEASLVWDVRSSGSYQVQVSSSSSSTPVEVSLQDDAESQKLQHSGIDALCAMGTNAINVAFDIDRNLHIDESDFENLLGGVLGTVRGDADLDGNVDLPDFLALSRNFERIDANWSDGDFDCNGVVDFADFLEIGRNFGRSRS